MFVSSSNIFLNSSASYGFSKYSFSCQPSFCFLIACFHSRCIPTSCARGYFSAVFYKMHQFYLILLFLNILASFFYLHSLSFFRFDKCVPINDFTFSLFVFIYLLSSIFPHQSRNLFGLSEVCSFVPFAVLYFNVCLATVCIYFVTLLGTRKQQYT